MNRGELESCEVACFLRAAYLDVDLVLLVRVHGEGDLCWNAGVVVEGQGIAVLLSFVDMVQCSAKRYGYGQASF